MIQVTCVAYVYGSDREAELRRIAELPAVPRIGEHVVFDALTKDWSPTSYIVEDVMWDLRDGSVFILVRDTVATEEPTIINNPGTLDEMVRGWSGWDIVKSRKRSDETHDDL